VGRVVCQREYAVCTYIDNGWLAAPQRLALSLPSPSSRLATSRMRTDVSKHRRCVCHNSCALCLYVCLWCTHCLMVVAGGANQVWRVGL